jgi:uncharacterized protein YdaU (DUF1376 family)
LGVAPQLKREQTPPAEVSFKGLFMGLQKMHYYQFNIGDYQSHTSHLSETEDLIYRRLLDWYYLHEIPIPPDVEQTARQIRMRSHCDSIADVLQEYFVYTENGWIHHRADKEIAKTGDKSEKASASAKARWSKARDANALPTQSERNATHNTEPITHNPIPNISICPPIGEPEDKTGLPKCCHQEVIDLYHKHLPTLRKVEVWNDARKGYLRQRWRDVAEELSKEKSIQVSDILEWWSDFFQHIGQSKFLMGRVNDKSGRTFTADLEWILKPSNFAKIIEGKYHGV